MRAARSELLARLVAATPPPPADATPQQLNAAAQAMIDVRASILVGHADVTGSHDPVMLAELDRRTAAWVTALAAGRDQLGASRVAAAKARAYRQSPRR